jgi:hypothetical protein
VGQERYSKKELNQIIERALRLQGEEEGQVVPREGHSIDDLIAVGRDLGIDEEQIRRAARDVETRRMAGTAMRWLGGEIVQEERLVLNHGVHQARAQELAADVERIVGLPGQVSTAGRRAIWQASYLAAQQRAWMLTVSVGAYEDQTVVEVESRNGVLAGGLFGGLGGGLGIGGGVGVGVGVGVGALGSPLFAVVFPLACIAGSFLFARTLFRAITRGRRRKIQRILERARELPPARSDA